jgi:hypothetical protein
VICERSPVDFLAYLLALTDLRRDEASTELIETSLPLVADGIQYLDLIIFLPLDDGGIAISDSEDPELRNAVDNRLVGIFGDNDYELFTSNRPVVLEARGSTGRRLQMLERALSNGVRRG